MSNTQFLLPETGNSFSFHSILWNMLPILWSYCLNRKKKGLGQIDLFLLNQFSQPLVETRISCLTNPHPY